jgi:hypothetical protein
MFYLLLAILAEATGTTCVKLSEGFTRLLPSALILVFYGLSLGFFGAGPQEDGSKPRLRHVVWARDSLHSLCWRPVVQGASHRSEGRLARADRGGSGRIESGRSSALTAGCIDVDLRMGQCMDG